jgi:DNA invertase Pin-like site-specific DNA recombinase
VQNETKIVTYRRVSTAKQGRSGLGLSDQHDKLAHYAAYTHATVVKEFTEEESGKIKSSDRKQLKAAIALAKAKRCTLVVAKLDRVGRRAADVLNLLDDKKLKVVFADSPTASRLENGVRAVFAEEEGRAISERTKAALNEARKQGVKLGNYDGGRALKAYTAVHGNVAGCEGAKRNADEFANGIRDFVEPLVKDGLSDAAIAAALNQDGIETRRGARWHETSVRRLRDRLAI